MDLGKNVRIAELLRIYGDLLSKKQRLYMDSYYNYDLSLAEISENHNISRAAVLDSLKQAIKKLETFEKCLHIYKNNGVLHDILKNKDINESLKKELERIIR